MSIVVFWLEAGQARQESFGADRLSEALARCESLRRAAAAGAEIRHVCLSTDFPDNVTKPGVADPLPDYSWTKRRGGRSPSPAGSD